MMGPTGRSYRRLSQMGCVRKQIRVALLLMVVVSVITPSVAARSQQPDAPAFPTPRVSKGDLDAMIRRGRIRVLVAYSKTFYFIDRGRQHGITYDALRAFERHVNAKLGRKTVKVRVVILPVRRDQLLPGLLGGRGDIAAANLTITSEREKQVDFSEPFLTDVRELVVTGPKAPPLRSVDDLGGQEIHVRPSSSYFESLGRLNATFRQVGKPYAWKLCRN